MIVATCTEDRRRQKKTEQKGDELYTPPLSHPSRYCMFSFAVFLTVT